MAEALTGLSIFGVAALLSYLMTPVLGRRALRLGHVDLPGGRKDQGSAVPYAGGRAILLACAVTVVGGALAAPLLGDLAALRPHLDGLRRRLLPLLAIVGGALLMAVMGRIDDRRDLRAGPRFLIQVLAALPLALGDQRLSLFIAEPILQVLLTLGWLVFMTNAANFIDNMDGLLAGVALIAIAAFAIFAATSGQLFVAAFALALAGAVSGVLPHNRRPARVYLGDEGSMLLGFLMGALAMVTSYRGGDEPKSLPFLAPLLLLAVPVVDASFVIATRLGRGVAPWTAGRDHLSHRLVARGLRPRATVRLLQGLGALGAALAFALYHRRPGALIAAGAFLVLALVRILGARRLAGSEA